MDFEANPRLCRSILKKFGKSIQLRKNTRVQHEINSFVAESISNYLRHHDVKTRFTSYYVRAYQVLGRPFLEHYGSRYPSHILRIGIQEKLPRPSGISGAGGTLCATSGTVTSPSAAMAETRTGLLEKALAEEEMYAILKPFGSLIDMRYLKEERVWEVEFSQTGAAVAVRNALHRAALDRVQVKKIGVDGQVAKKRVSVSLFGGGEAGSRVDDGEEDDADAGLVKRIQRMVQDVGAREAEAERDAKARDEFFEQSLAEADGGTTGETASTKKTSAAKQAKKATAVPDSWVVSADPTVPIEHFYVSYRQVYDLRSLREQLMSNWRGVVAGFIALMGLSTAFLFDPMRLFFCKRNISQTYFGKDLNAPVMFSGGSDGGGPPLPGGGGAPPGSSIPPGGPPKELSGSGAYFPSWLFRDQLSQEVHRNRWLLSRTEEVQQLRHWLRQDPPERVMLLSGPRGDGKDLIVPYLLKDTPGVVDLDFGPLLERHQDERFLLKSITSLFGYFPAMTSVDQSMAVLDTMIPGASRMLGSTGGGIGERVQQLVFRVLSFTTVALSELKRSHDDYKDSKYPLFIVRGFTHENVEALPKLFDALVRWAAAINERKLGKVGGFFTSLGATSSSLQSERILIPVPHFFNFVAVRVVGNTVGRGV